MANKPHQDADAYFSAVQDAIEYGSPVVDLNAVDILNAAADHVAILLDDAMSAFHRQSFGTSVFLAITALEETAKAEIMAMRSKTAQADSQRARDPLRDHRKKHQIAVRPTTFMGRLPELLGPPACERLQKEAETGGLIRLRERALYVHLDAKGISSPSSSVTRERAREILLLALESADDIIVGWTNASFALGKKFEAKIVDLASEVG